MILVSRLTAAVHFDHCATLDVSRGVTDGGDVERQV